MLTTRRTRDGSATIVPRSSSMASNLTSTARSTEVAEDNTYLEAHRIGRSTATLRACRQQIFRAIRHARRSAKTLLYKDFRSIRPDCTSGRLKVQTIQVL